jgi:hypothetical protein
VLLIFSLPEKYFTPVTCFLFFNAFAMLGNLTTEWIRKVSLALVLKWAFSAAKVRNVFIVIQGVLCLVGYQTYL